MKNQNIKTLEGALHRLKINFSGNVDFNDYEVYGSCSSYGCSQCVHFEVTEKREDGCTVIIPALRCGIYKYQLFIKQISSNQEYLILSGDITAKDRICDCGDAVNDSAQTVIDAVISADTVQVEVTIEKGPKGDTGERGEKGEKGEDGRDGVDGKDGKDGKDGEDGTIDLSFLGNNVLERTSGRAVDNHIIYGFGWTFTKTGYVDMIQLQSAGEQTQLEEGERFFIKVWDAASKLLLSKSKNSIISGIRDPLYLEPFVVNKGQEVKITFHKIEDGNTSLKVGIAINMRITLIGDGESGGIMDNTGNYSDTTKTATIRWNFFENKFASKEELSEHAANDSHLSDEQKTLLEQVKNGEIGGGGASIDWISAQPVNENKANPATSSQNSIAIGYGAITEDNPNLAIGNFAHAKGNEVVSIGGGNQSEGNFITSIGRHNGCKKDYNVMIGTNYSDDSGTVIINSKGERNVTIGTGVQNYGSNSILIGSASMIMGGENSIVIGGKHSGDYHSYDSGSLDENHGRNVIIGHEACTNDMDNVIIGFQAKAMETWGYARTMRNVVMGCNAVVRGSENVAIGQNACGEGDGGIGIGYGACGGSDKGVAIGYNAQAYSGIAIGENAYSNGEITFENGNGLSVKFYEAYQDDRVYDEGGIVIHTNIGSEYVIPYSQLTGGGSDSDGGSSSSSSSMDWPALFAGDYYGYTDRFADANDTSQVFWSDRKEYLDAEGAWNYNLVNITESDPGFSYWYEEHNESYGNLRAFNSFMGNVPSLTNSFIHCLYLESWNCPTPQCSNFQYTFQECCNLKHWRGDLSALENAYGMFGTYSEDCCQLDLASVQHIAKVIRYGSWNQITLGVSNALNGSAELEQAINEIYNKNWSVEVIYSSKG